MASNRAAERRVNQTGEQIVTVVRTPPRAQQNRSAERSSNDFDELYTTHHLRILRLCRWLLTDPHEAEEVHQEVFLKLLREQQRDDRNIAWGPWLTRVTINACRDRRRSGWWKWWRERHEDFDATEWPAAESTPEEQVVSAEQHRRIWEAFRTLPPRQQEVFALRHLEGWSTEAAAEALGVSTGSVKRHLFRAVRHLRRALGARE
jgi:RNA polymerase sigma-70 factor, ECF subfamily